MTARRRGFTLIEGLVAVTILAILLTAAIPRMRRASEQMRLDAAALRLRSVWSAQRVHWLEHGVFASTMGALNSEQLIDPSLGAGTDGSWAYSISSTAPERFVATATRESGGWMGSMEIDETGVISGGMVTPDGTRLTAMQQ